MALVIGFASGLLAMLAVSLVPILLSRPPFVHWTWYVLIGSGVTIGVGILSQRLVDREGTQ
ncbi:MAG: hypothetical protein J7L94_11095 [Caldisericaceae bacterium]|nr:hypothetical protein [Caldisericaceae bacterium]